jgi:hypothetical protein
MTLPTAFKYTVKYTIAALAAVTALSFTSSPAKASDHDDGVSRLKTRNRNLTDLYVFREDNQTGRAADSANLIFVMNSDPRAPAGRQEAFSTGATYDFHVTQVAAADKNSTPTGAEDLLLRFSFGAPDQAGHQAIKVNSLHRGAELQSENDSNLAQGAMTTTLAESKAGQPRMNKFRFRGGEAIDVFAGLREDPFFFDVDQFLKIRQGALGLGPKVGFRPAAEAVDFTTGFNVNTIVVRVPISLLQWGGNSAPIFDVWETVSVNGKQIERLARPAINEGLIETNGFLNAFNMIPPSADLSPAAAPVRAEAAKTLLAFDMLDGKIDIPVAKVVTAFLPDVMRIDSRVSIPVGKTAYNADLSGDKGILTGGRKLQDDVMDITLSLLVAGDATGMAVKDNVTYEGFRGNSHQGHSPLNGQTRAQGSATFPFLALPN